MKPNIRFNGFGEEWVERKFFDNINSVFDFRGKTPRKLGMNWNEDKSGFLALSALNVKNGYIDMNADAHYGDKTLYDAWMNDKELYKGQVVMTTEAPMGNVVRIPDNKRYILSQRTIAFKTNPQKITDNFLAVILRSPKSYNKLLLLSSGGTAKGVSQKSLSHFSIELPANVDEQQKIGALFEMLDAQIAAEQAKIDWLKEQKKGLLERVL